MTGFAVGSLTGLAMSEWCTEETTVAVLRWVSPFGSVLIAMLKTVVYPIILFSLISGAAALPIRKSGRIGVTVIIWYTATSIAATVFGVLLAYAANPAATGFSSLAAGHLAGAKALVSGGTVKSMAEFATSLFQNPFSSLAEGQFLPVIVFAIAFGLAARSILDSLDDGHGEIAKSISLLLDAVNGAQRVSFKLIDWTMQYFPIGVFALAMTNFAMNGTLLFGPYLRITCCIMTGVASMILVIYPLAVAVFCRENPYKMIFRLRETLLTAFVTRSSAATLPVSFRAMDSLGVNRSLSSFSLPLGATVNMDGVCIHLPVFVILAANMFGHHLSFLQIATLCISIMFASVGAGGIPGGSLFLLFMVLENMGLPADQVTLVVALALGINPILDMFETCCNVAGDNVCTYIVARKNGLMKDA